MDKIINITIHYGPLTKNTDAEASKINKERLNRIVRKELGFSKDKKFSLTRKSKRSKTYVPLKESTDFRALNRSLEVKNHLKLKVEDIITEGATEIDINDGKKNSEKTETVRIPKEDYKQLMNKIEDIHKSVIKDDIPVAQNYEPLVVHKDVFCDACSINDNIVIKGDRFKCRRCYDYDLCSKCYKSGKTSGHHSTHHEMLRIPRPAEALCPVVEYKKQTEQQQQESFTQSSIDKNCIFVDIPVELHESKDYESEIVDLVNTYNDVTKLKALKQKLETFDKLVKLTNNDENLLSAVVNSYVDSQKTKVVSTGPKLSVEVSKLDQTLIFHLRNNGILVTPKNLSLIFSYLNKGSLTKFSLSIGPHAIHPEGHKRLYYNMNGIGNDFFEYSGKFTIELVKEDGEKYASGLCSNGSGVVFLTNNNELKELSETEDDTESSSSSTTEKYLTPSNSSFIVPDNDVETKVESDDDDEDFKEKTLGEETDDTADEITISDALDDQSSSKSENIRSSTITLTPEYVEVNENIEDTDDNSAEFTDDEIDEDAESFPDDYEVLSTDDYYTENE